jgi:hypothetical protein
MNYKIQIVVTLQVDVDEPHTKAEVKKAAVQAVENAVRMGEDNGFCHDRADDVSFRVVTVEVAD